MIEIRRLDRDHLTRAYGLDSERLLPWDALTAPFEGAWCILRAGEDSTAHAHHEYEIFIAMSGRATLVVDGDRAEFAAGDVAHLPPGRTHQVVNDGAEDFEYYGIWWDAAMSADFLDRHHERAMPAEREMVISPAPTANGDLHLGHLAGPFLAADVYTRYARAAGREVLFGTGIQDTPSYVVTTASRLEIEPRVLVARSTEQIEMTLATMGIEVDGFTGGDDRFVKWVLEFLSGLHAAGRLRLQTMTFPYLPGTGEYLVDGYVRGGCPTCLADGCAGLCEGCGNLVAAGELVDPRSTMHPEEPVELRAADVLVLPLEEYRDRLRAHFAGPGSGMRPHMAQAVAAILSRPLPDYPVTYPVPWGIPAPFPEVAGQTINPNAEPMAWSMHCTALSAQRHGAVLASEDELWLAEAGTRVTYFLGFDNIYPFAIAGLAMLMAYGDCYLRPARFVTNEFYELDSAKFSTSRGHVVWGRDLVAQVPSDLVRFHLAATSPEHQRTDFSRAALARVTGSRLVGPWNRIAAKVDRWVGRGPLPVSPRSHAAAERIIERFAVAYELPWFSLNRAAETLTEQLARLDRWDVQPGAEGDFCHEVEAVLRCAAPILTDLARRALPGTAIPGGAAPATVAAVRLPRLDPAPS